VARTQEDDLSQDVATRDHKLESDTIVEALARRASAVQWDDAPDAVQRKVQDCLLHAFVVAAGAGETEFPAVVERAVGESLGADGGSTVLLGLGRAPAATAAWANAVLLHSRVQEDTHDTVHPGVVVIPAALALAQRRGVSGVELLVAVLRGYEVAVTLSRALNARVTPPFRATGAFGPMAAAAAAASVLGLDRDGFTRALALAASMAGGTTESFAAGTQEWHFQAGQASMTGVLAAELAHAGVPASRRAFEGKGGYLAAFAGGAREDDPARIARELASGWGIVEVTFKPYPVCAFNQAPAAAAVDLATRLHGLEPDSVEVRMSPGEAAYPGVDNTGPITTAEQAIMSAQCAVAAALLDENVTFRRLRAAEVPAMRSLMNRITVVGDVDVPNKQAVVTVRTVEGDVVTATSPDMDSALRWKHAAVVDNARRLLPETCLAEQGLDGLDAAIAGLAAAPGLEALVAALP
jgi:2-methylcitrate dehydratase PrpD